MQESIVFLLRCPLSSEKLSLEVIKQFTHPLTKQTEIHSGYLWSANGGCYPIINGIPRMLPESCLDYADQLQEWWPDFPAHKERICTMYNEAMKASAIQHKKIQSTFGFEWNLLRKNNNLRIWGLDAVQFHRQVMKELRLPGNYTCKLALDAGCGHGRSAGYLAAIADTVIGVEVSPAVDLAYEQNTECNCHFIQADIYYLPFSHATFDLVYSSGVLHHNGSTQTALQKVAMLVKPHGILSVWLYHPFKNALHYCMCVLRGITKYLPVQAVYYMCMFTLTPLQWLFSQFAGQKKKWTEIAIEQLDMLTPRYRHEHTHNEVKAWLKEIKFENPEITDTDNYGFSMKATKN